MEHAWWILLKISTLRSIPSAQQQSPTDQLLNSKTLKLHKQQWVPVALPEVFSFFSDPQNLSKITPPWVGFKILTPAPVVMGTGTLIDYEVRLHHIPMRWRSEITEWMPPYRFCDVQLKGPYSYWRHVHSFAESNGGTLVSDDIEYSIPFGWMPGASLIEALFVKPELERIFTHRGVALRTEFGLDAEDEGPPKS